MADYKQIVRYVLRKRENELLVDICTITFVQYDYQKKKLVINLIGGTEIELDESRAIKVYLDITERLMDFNILMYSTFDTVDLE